MCLGLYGRLVFVLREIAVESEVPVELSVFD
jgi:hypothetical protein